MTDRQPVHWGNIGAETAKSAAALLENGERHENQGYPFANIAVTGQGGASSNGQSDLREIRDAKNEVEQVCRTQPLKL